MYMAWEGVIYNGKCNYYVLTNCIRHRVRREFIQNYFENFIFFINLGQEFGIPLRLTGSKLSGYVPEY